MTKEQRMFAWVMVVAYAVGTGVVVLDVVPSVKARHDAKLPPPPVKVVRDGWKEAHKAGAPIYRYGEQPADWPTLDPLPASKAYVLTGNGVAFATDDLAEVKRWYAQLTFPALDYSQWKDVRYVYEVTAARVDKDAVGVPHLIVTVHEARTGCVAPACDPVHGLPNYDRTYEVPVSSMTIHIERGVNA
jgi:hypothetical protein